MSPSRMLRRFASVTHSFHAFGTRSNGLRTLSNRGAAGRAGSAKSSAKPFGALNLRYRSSHSSVRASDWRLSRGGAPTGLRRGGSEPGEHPLKDARIVRRHILIIDDQGLDAKLLKQGPPFEVAANESGLYARDLPRARTWDLFSRPHAAPVQRRRSPTIPQSARRLRARSPA